MKALKSEFKERPACADKYAPLPESVICPGCGQEVEIWSDEDRAACTMCGRPVER